MQLKNRIRNIRLGIISFLHFLRLKNKVWYGKIIRLILYPIFCFVISIIAIEQNVFSLFGYSPSIYELKKPQHHVASEMYASQGEYLGRFFYQNRSLATYEEISPLLIQTLVATEDARFYMHNGVDFKSMPSLFMEAIRGNPRGGSTITQQLIKNLYKTRNRNHGPFEHIPYLGMGIIKIKEWISALKIELFFTKEEILVLYLNTVDFGSGAFGIKTAAQTYFKKTPMELRAPECALLVGILNAPTAYSPVLNPEQSLRRRNIVLRIMARDKIITTEEFDAYSLEPLNLNFSIERPFDGIANYYRQAVRLEIAPWLKKNNYNIFTDGLKIYTTLNYNMQIYAELAVYEHMRKLQNIFNQHWEGLNPWIDNRRQEIPQFIETVITRTPFYRELSKKYADYPDSINYYIHKKEHRTLFSWHGNFDTICSFYEATDYLKRLLHAGFVAIDAQTGYIMAYVGGINFNHFKFDNCRTKRQPGSTFKAFVYGAAIEQGWAPCDSLPDRRIPIRYIENGEEKVWFPRNANWEYADTTVSLKLGFAQSLNTIAVQLSQKVGIENIIQFAHKTGITSPLDTVPSLSLGSSEVSLLELTSAYTTLINGGHAISPVFVTRIEDRFGTVLAEFSPQKTKVLSDETVFLLQQLFLGTMTEPYGTTQGLYAYNIFNNLMDFCGKTGTSSNYSDGWFIGITPTLVCGTWVGAEERSVHFRTSQLGEGGKTALPIYGLFMQHIMNDPSFSYLHAKFPRYFNTSQVYNCRTPFVPRDTIPTEIEETGSFEDVIIPDLEEIPQLRR